MNRKNPVAMSRQSGFSLIELMIAVTLGLIVLAALTTFFVQTSANRTEMERNTRQIENGRYAIDSMREDVALAGFFSDTAPLVTPTWTATVPCPADATSYGFAASPGVYTAPLPVFGYADATGTPGCLANILPGSDVLVVRRFSSEPNTVAEAAAGTAAARWYLQNSQCVDDSPDFPFKVGAGSSGVFALREVKCAAVARVWRLREQIYYLRTCSVCPPDAPVDNIPTLWRAELDPADTSGDGDPIMRHSALVEGIEALRFVYGIDNGLPAGSAIDGRPDEWKPCDGITCDGDWANVTSVKVYVLSRNLEESRDYTDTKTYSMGPAGTLGPFNDKYKRHVYSAQIAMPNRSGYREPKLSAPPPM
jgi:type IV pilus assembly protein PilW